MFAYIFDFFVLVRLLTNFNVRSEGMANLVVIWLQVELSEAIFFKHNKYTLDYTPTMQCGVERDGGWGAKGRAQINSL